MRLDRYLSNMGCGSRKEVRKLVRSGAITVNGKPVRDEDYSVEPGQDRVNCSGSEIHYTRYLYLMLNKPGGVISATEDGRERTVLDLLDAGYQKRGLFPVGRLDKDTEGLLILTNHGELGHRLLAPKRHVPKRYLARVAGTVDGSDQEAFRNGVDIGGYTTLPAELEIIDSGTLSEVMIVIREGKFHQIKRMFEARGKAVLYLKRQAMGELELDPDLPSGAYRELREDEIAHLMRAAALE